MTSVIEPNKEIVSIEHIDTKEVLEIPNIFTACGVRTQYSELFGIKKLNKTWKYHITHIKKMGRLI